MISHLVLSILVLSSAPGAPPPEGAPSARTTETPVAEPSSPAPAWEGFVDTLDGVRLFARRYRPADPPGPAAPPLLVPNAVYLESPFRYLAADREVIFYDLRGRGRSQTITDPEKLGIGFDVADMEAVRRHFGLDRVALLGHSYLGYAVALYALEHPERVDRLVQVGPLGPATEFPARAPQPEDVPTAIDVDAWEELTRELAAGAAEEDPEGMTRRFREVFTPYMFGDPEKARGYEAPPLDLPNEQVHRMFATIGAVMASFGDYDVRDDVARLDLPVLIVHGTADRQAPYESARAWLDAWPDAHLLTVEGAGHLPYAEAPDLVKPAVRTFLAGEWPEAAEPKQPQAAEHQPE